MTVSVIIPCYNCEHYISETLESLFKQEQLPDEVICINDGSVDNTASIIHEYSKKSPCLITLISQPNSGVSVARNTGIENASGDILLFLDSDDQFAPCFIGLVKQFFSEGFDCIYSYYTHDIKNLCYLFDKKNKIRHDKVQAMEDFMYQRKHCHAMCVAYSRDLIYQYELRFTPNVRYGEDWEFTFKYMDICNNILCLQENMMFYRINQSSAMRKSTYSRVDAIQAAERVEQFLQKRNSENYNIFASHMKYRTIFATAHAFAKLQEKRLFQKLCSEYPVAQSMKVIATNQNVSLKVRLAACSYCCSRWIFFYITGRR